MNVSCCSFSDGKHNPKDYGVERQAWSYHLLCCSITKPRSSSIQCAMELPLVGHRMRSPRSTEEVFPSNPPCSRGSLWAIQRFKDHSLWCLSTSDHHLKLKQNPRSWTHAAAPWRAASCGVKQHARVNHCPLGYRSIIKNLPNEHLIMLETVLQQSSGLSDNSSRIPSIFMCVSSAPD